MTTVGGMNVLLVQPCYPVTYWGFQHAMPIVRRKVSLPPLGLITVAALLPESWAQRLVDLNAAPLDDDDLRWADVVLTGGMRVQAESMRQVAKRAHELGRPVVVGGPAVTADPELVPGADVVFLGEAEGRADELVAAIEEMTRGPLSRATGASKETPALRLHPRGGFPPMEQASVPRFDLLDMESYISMAVQFSRGCPFGCEFCDVVSIFGRRSRVKPGARLLGELDALYQGGYRGTLFFVDDNFIGNRREVRNLLAELSRWQEERGHPFEIYTEASVDLARDETLLDEMVAAGFSAVFLGIETPSTSALEEAGKAQNLQIDLADAVNRITSRGLEVMGGFIVGFDNDRPEVFGAQRDFISSLPIPLAMVGILSAMPGTDLWRRLEKEGRLRGADTGDQFGRPNFEPRMDERELLSGYAELLSDLYTPEEYYRRCHAYLDKTRPFRASRSVRPGGYKVLLRSIWRIGIKGERRRQYWRLILSASRRGMGALSWAVGKTIQGEHLIRYTREEVLPRLSRALSDLGQRQGFPTSSRARV